MAPEYTQSFDIVGWKEGRATRQMPQQERFKTGVLPDNRDSTLFRKPSRPLRPYRISLGLVSIEHHEPIRWFNASPSQAVQLLNCEPHSRQRIACAPA